MGRDQKWTTRTSRGRGAAAVATVLIVSLMALPVVGTPAAATFPGEDGIIAWKEVVVGGWNCNAGAQIMTANPDGTDVRVRTAGHSPEFSPDGTRLAFSTGVTPGAQIGITDLITDTTQLITSGYNPSWAPDGSKLAIQRADGLYI